MYLFEKNILFDIVAVIIRGCKIEGCVYDNLHLNNKECIFVLITKMMSYGRS